MFEKLGESSGNVIGYKVSGTVTKSDYNLMKPEVEELVRQQGSIRMLLDVDDLKREAVKAWGVDLQFGREFHKKIDRMAIVGDKQWEKVMARLSKPFYARDARFFHKADEEAAWSWLRQ